MMLVRWATWGVLSGAVVAWALAEPPVDELPVITPAFKWAESDDSVELWVKFAHKLDVPAVAGVRDEDVSVKWEDARTCVIDAFNAQKKFHLRIPLFDDIVPEESSYTRKTFGILVVMKKAAKVGQRWKHLTPKKLAKSLGIRIAFWHERQLTLDNEDEKKRIEATKVWRAYEHKCEVCRDLFFAAFRDETFHAIKDLRTYRAAVPVRSGSYNLTAAHALVGACDRLNPMIETAVKIKGASVGTSKWRADTDDNPLNPEARETCEAMFNYEPVFDALLETFARYDGYGAKTREDIIFETRMEELAAVCVVAAKACPRKMTPLGRTASKCTACNSIVSIADAKLRVRSKPPTQATAEVVLSDLCGLGLSERIGDAHVASATCETITEDHDAALIQTLIEAPDARTALDFCKNEGFCTEPSKKRKHGPRKRKPSRTKKEL